MRLKNDDSVDKKSREQAVDPPKLRWRREGKVLLLARHARVTNHMSNQKMKHFAEISSPSEGPAIEAIAHGSIFKTLGTLMTMILVYDTDKCVCIKVRLSAA